MYGAPLKHEIGDIPIQYFKKDCRSIELFPNDWAIEL